MLDDRSSAEITRLPRAEYLVGRILEEKVNLCVVMSESLLRNYLLEAQGVSARCRCLAPVRLINGDYNAKDSSNHSRRATDCRVDSSSDRSSRAPHAQGGPRARIHEPAVSQRQ